MTATSTRRAVLAGAAALPALSLPIIAAEPDPIFEAIERHRAPESAFSDFLKTESRKQTAEEKVAYDSSGLCSVAAVY